MTATATTSPPQESSVLLNTGYLMPRIGLGTWPLQGSACTAAVLSALEAGYRLIDTAAHYGNESAVGRAARASGVDRSEVFVTSKLQGRNQGREFTRAGVEGSLERLGMDYIDLFMIHWPMPRLGRYVDTYIELLDLAEKGLIRSVGVSNFTLAHIDAVVAATGSAPAVDQLQVSPSFPRADLVAAVQQRTCIVQAWSPFDRNTGVLDRGPIEAIASRAGVSAAQVVLSWLLHRGVSAVPHSSNPERQRSNLDVFGLVLSSSELAVMDSLAIGSMPDQDPDEHEEF